MHFSRTPQPADAEPLWIVAVWPDESCRYLPVAAFATREEAAVEAAKRVGAVILYRPAPTPSPAPPSAPPAARLPRTAARFLIPPAGAAGDQDRHASS